MHMFSSDVDNKNAQSPPFVLYMYASRILEGVFNEKDNSVNLKLRQAIDALTHPQLKRQYTN